MPLQVGKDLSLALVLTAKNLMGKGTRDAEKDISKLSGAAKKTAKDIEAAYHNLGIRSEREIRREVQKMQASYKRLSASGKLSAKEQKRAYKALTDQLKELRREAKGATGDVKGIGAGLGGLLTGAGIGIGLKSVIQAGIELERIELTMLAVTGSSHAAGIEFDFVSKEAERLGLNLQRTAQNYAQMMAASKGTKLEGQGTRDIFKAVAEASAVLGLSAADNEGILRSLNQMMSKGTVQAEELRGQLGERLPGAFNLAAKAMGVTTAELNKMLEQGQVISDDFLPKLATQITKEYGDKVPAAMKRASASFERLNTSIFEMKTELAKGGIVDAASDVADAVGKSAKYVKAIITAIKVNAIEVAHFIDTIGASEEELTRKNKIRAEVLKDLAIKMGDIKTAANDAGIAGADAGARTEANLKAASKAAAELKADLEKIGAGAAKAISPALKSLGDLQKAMETQYSKNKSLREKVFNATGGAAAGHFNDQINAMKAEAKAMLGAQIAESDVAAYIEQQLATLQQSMQKAGADIQAGYIGGMDAGSFVAQLSADVQASSTHMGKLKKLSTETANELSKMAASFSKTLDPKVAEQFLAQIDAMRESLVGMSNDANIEAQFDTLQAITEINRIQTELANIPREIVTYHKIVAEQEQGQGQESEFGMGTPEPPGVGTRATGGSIPVDGLYYMHAGEQVQSNSTSFGDFNYHSSKSAKDLSYDEWRAIVRDIIQPELRAMYR